MATFVGTAANEIITPGFVSATVLRFPIGSFPGAGNDILNGGAGADLMNGWLGNDLYIVDNFGDVVVEAVGGAAGGVDTVQSSVTYTLSVNVENLTLTGAAAINGTGNASANVILGNAANNILSGLAGNDSLNGGDGNDTLNGGTGADNMNGGLGNDLYIVDNAGDVAAEVAGGIDTVQASVTHALSANMENLRLTGIAAINGTGNANANVISGNGADNNLFGLGGNDMIVGGAGDDNIFGGSGNDNLNGGSGDDWVEGGVGRDVLTGGLGLDTFDFDFISDSPPGIFARDVITDFVGNGIFAGDVIDLSTIDANGAGIGNGTFTYIGAAAFSANATAELRYAGGVLQGSVDADGFAEFEIQLTGAPGLIVGAFAGSDVIL